MHRLYAQYLKLLIPPTFYNNFNQPQPLSPLTQSNTQMRDCSRFNLDWCKAPIAGPMPHISDTVPSDREIDFLNVRISRRIVLFKKIYIWVIRFISCSLKENGASEPREKKVAKTIGN